MAPHIAAHWNIFAVLLRWIYSNGTKKIDIKRMKVYADFDLLIFDEIHKLKNYKAQQSKIALELSKKIKHVIGLTGTPIGNNLLDLFNEMRVIDLGKTFHHAQEFAFNLFLILLFTLLSLGYMMFLVNKKNNNSPIMPVRIKLTSKATALGRIM